jgi:ribose/xylose/arabinose/galactoside ABC-type transport system permease subunit
MQELGLIIVIAVVSLFLWLASHDISKVIPAKEVTDSAGHVVTLPMMTSTENGFLRVQNIAIVLTYMSWMAIMAMGQTTVIISGGIDISVGSIMGLSALVTALVLQNFAPDAPAWQIIPLGIGIPLGVGLLCGFINGILVVGLRMHPFIVTLATLSIFRWACLKIGAAHQGSLPSGDKVLPDAFGDRFVAWEFHYHRFGGRITENIQPVPFLVMLLCLLLGWLYLRHTVWGRENYAVGGNEEAAKFSGIRVPYVKLRVYLISGLSCGIAGMLNCGFFKSAVTDTGKGYELNVIAAAVVGGASLLGGRGTALGAVLGMLVLGLIENGINILQQVNLGVTTVKVVREDQQLILGVAVILAVAVDQFSMYLQSRRSARLRTAH